MLAQKSEQMYERASTRRAEYTLLKLPRTRRGRKSPSLQPAASLHEYVLSRVGRAWGMGFAEEWLAKAAVGTFFKKVDLKSLVVPAGGALVLVLSILNYRGGKTRAIAEYKEVIAMEKEYHKEARKQVEKNHLEILTVTREAFTTDKASSKEQLRAQEVANERLLELHKTANENLLTSHETRASNVKAAAQAKLTAYEDTSQKQLDAQVAANKEQLEAQVAASKEQLEAQEAASRRLLAMQEKSSEALLQVHVAQSLTLQGAADAKLELAKTSTDANVRACENMGNMVKQIDALMQAQSESRSESAAAPRRTAGMHELRQLQQGQTFNTSLPRSKCYDFRIHMQILEEGGSPVLRISPTSPLAASAHTNAGQHPDPNPNPQASTLTLTLTLTLTR